MIELLLIGAAGLWFLTRDTGKSRHSARPEKGQTGHYKTAADTSAEYARWKKSPAAKKARARFLKRKAKEKRGKKK